MSNIQDSISDLRIAIGKAKAIAEAFAQEFIEPDTTERRIIAIQAAPARHEYLFCALQEALYNAEQQAVELNEAQ